MEKNKKLRATMTLEQDEMIVLKGGGVNPPTCTITKCPACAPCDALSTSGWMKGYDTKSN